MACSRVEYTASTKHDLNRIMTDIDWTPGSLLLQTWQGSDRCQINKQSLRIYQIEQLQGTVEFPQISSTTPGHITSLSLHRNGAKPLEYDAFWSDIFLNFLCHLDISTVAAEMSDVLEDLIVTFWFVPNHGE